MNKSNLAVEIFPRALWVVHVVCLYLGQHLTHRPPVLNNNIVFLCLGALMTLGGLLSFFYVGHFMRRALITKELVTDGPFRYVRHPMYVALYAAFLGTGLLFFSWVWFAIMVAFIPVWYVDCRIEERQMIDLHGERYLDYMGRTGMFLPRIGWEVTSRA